jgi:hypothetical protein
MIPVPDGLSARLCCVIGSYLDASLEGVRPGEHFCVDELMKVVTVLVCMAMRVEALVRWRPRLVVW